MVQMPDIVDAVLAFLCLLSVCVWAIALAKAIGLTRLKRQNHQFLQAFNTAKSVTQLKVLASGSQGSLASICTMGLQEVESLDTSAKSGSKSRRELLLNGLREQAFNEQSRAEKGLAVLASIGSTAPFIGLFGTVWGIMHALKDISSTGSAGLDVVAGPIGEALIATAIGIVTAVPAVLAYNYFSRLSKQHLQQIDIFALKLQSSLIRFGLLEE